MGHAYTAVQWNRQKMFYDGVLLTGIALYVGGFIWLTPELHPNAESWNVRMRAYGSAAFILLHIILSIGPLCRLDKRFLPLLYNRRHMGVTMCLLGVLHSRTVLVWYHDFSSTKLIVSLFASNTEFASFVDFPFEMLGAGALLSLGLMAATSHDFWLVNLTAPVWKALHMGVYLAYVLLVGHVLLGPLQSNQDPTLTGLVVLGALWIVGIHLVAAWREKTLDVLAEAGPESLVRVGAVSDPRGRGESRLRGGRASSSLPI